MDEMTKALADPVNELAAWLIALEDAEMYVPVPASLVEHGRNFVRAGLTEKHCGDCTNESHSCVVCQTSDATAKARQILAALAAQPAALVGEPVGYQFRQRSAVGNGPQSRLPWCDWCSIEREDYERYIREPNPLVEVRRLYAALSTNPGEQ